MRLCAVQLQTVVGETDVNAKHIKEWVQKATSLSADVVLFPECSLTGYLPLDRLFHPEFVNEHQHRLNQIRDLSQDIDILIGSLDHSPLKTENRFYNAYHYFSKGKLKHSVYKTHLPNDDIFYESRFFAPNPKPGLNNIIQIGPLRFGIGICEDMWNDTRLFETIVKASPVDFFICPSASPYTLGKPILRKIQIRRIIKKFPKPFLFLNQVATYDGILLDGHSYFINENLKIQGQLPTFEEHAFILDITPDPPHSNVQVSTCTLKATKPAPNHKPKDTRKPRIQTLATGIEFGLKHFIHGSGLQRAIICVSGGIDSALALMFAKRALGADNCFALILPSPYNKRQGTLDAISLCQKHGIQYQTIPITKLMNQFYSILKRCFGTEAKSILFQNIQARIRGVLAMAFANHQGACLVGTSNKSELSMGYATLYGDLCAGILPLGDLLKSQIYTLTQYYRDIGEYIPDAILKRVPSAELAPGQKDSDDLPPYQELDQTITELLIREITPDATSEASPLMQKVESALKRTQFKRKQSAPIIKISQRDLCRGRQVIISGGSSLSS